MQDDNTPSREGDQVGKLKQELKEKDEEIKEMKSALKSLRHSDLEVDLDKAQKLIEEEKRRSEEHLTRLRYLQADFENYRKRVDREMRDIEDFSTSGLMKKLLPVLDDLDLAVASAETSADRGLLEGVGMVRKNLTSVLQSEGLNSIDAVGRPFDPALHEAVERVDGTKKSKEDTVVEEMRKGYIFKNKVLRPSMVKVESAMKNDDKDNNSKNDDAYDDNDGELE
jgi:molecular chaperone GrpE